MAADSGNFQNFNNSEISARLALQKRPYFRVPPQPSPFVAHFYPMVNAGGNSSPFLPPETTHLSPNPSALLASVAANRADLIYSELKNLFKTVGSYPHDVKSNFRPINESHNSSGEIKSNFSEDNFPINESPFKTSKKTNDILENQVGFPSLRFTEGTYSSFTPNDFLLRIRAEQQRAAKESAIQKEGTLRSFPFATSSLQFPGLHLQGGAFSRTSKHNWKPQYPLHTSDFQATPEFPHQSKPSPEGVNSSKHARTSPGHTVSTIASPLDFRVHKLHSAGSGHNDSGRRSYSDSVDSRSTNQEFDFNPNPIQESRMMPEVNGKSEAVPTESYIDGKISVGDDVNATDKHDELKKIKPTSGYSPRESVLTRTSPAPEPRSKRRRRMTSTVETCPVCGITVRASDMKQHFLQEVTKLDKIEIDVYRSSRKVYPDRKTSGSISGSSSEYSHTSVTATSNKNNYETETVQSINKDNRLKTFQKVRGNRIYRFNNRVGQCQSSVPHGFLPPKVNGGVSWLDYKRNALSHAKSMSYGRFEGVRCPVCDISLSHMENHDQISDHVIQCAGSPSVCNSQVQENDDERNKRHFGEEYEWCGETRVRATALIHRATLASSPGFQVIRNTDNEDSDQDLNVETDETCEYGAAQFSENDLVPPSSSHEELESKPDTIEPTGNGAATEESCAASTQNTAGSPSCSQGNCQSPSVIVQALRLKIQEYENGKTSIRCLICMESYSKPLVSIQCWHVHCEKCWMRALGVKKLCPQCNMITPTSQLRRIYL